MCACREGSQPRVRLGRGFASLLTRARCFGEPRSLHRGPPRVARARPRWRVGRREQSGSAPIPSQYGVFLSSPKGSMLRALISAVRLRVTPNFT